MIKWKKLTNRKLLITIYSITEYKQSNWFTYCFGGMQSFPHHCLQYTFPFFVYSALLFKYGLHGTSEKVQGSSRIPHLL